MEEIGIELKLEVRLTPLMSLSIAERVDLQDSTIPSQASEKQALLKSLPSRDEELYSTWKRLEAHREFLELQEVSKSRVLRDELVVTRSSTGVYTR